MHSLFSGLPAIAFATLALTGETVAIFRGEPRHYRVDTHKSVTELNRMYGVSPAQARAMLAGALLGWDSKLADPALYDERGELLDPADFEADEAITLGDD
jgi:hypothetical protein